MSALVPSASTSITWVDRPGAALMRLSWLLTISMVSFSTMTLASTAFVAHIGADELAGVGLGGIIGFTLVCFGIGLLRGAKTLVSQVFFQEEDGIRPWSVTGVQTCALPI